MLFQLILSHSGWRYAEVATGETFLVLQRCRSLQNALWELGGVHQVVRSDNTSATTHEDRRSCGRALILAGVSGLAAVIGAATIITLRIIRT